jgi:Suppressor of fused protein (SUFU)
MSNDKPVRSPGGSEIFRHQPVERDIEAPVEAASVDEIEAHFTRVFGKPEQVFHELVSDIVHIDVHIIPPAAGRDHWTLFTTGMSALPMSVPEHIENAAEFEYAELMIKLPASWKVGSNEDRWFWPLKWLKRLARLPHEYQTWIGSLHTIPNGDPAKPFASGTKLCCWMLVPLLDVEEGDRRIELKDGRTVNIYSLLALHPEEVSLKLNKGAEALIEAMDAAGVDDVLQVARPPVVKKKLFGLF